MSDANIIEIARRNDLFRTNGLRYMITRGVQALPRIDELIHAVRAYKDFTMDNDPWGEHDFGSLEWMGETIFWKIDYYDQAMEGWADPASDDCHRVLTIMTASEY